MRVKGLDKRVNIIVEPKNNGYSPLVVAIPSYACFKPGSSKINMSLQNLTSRSIMIKEKSIVAQLAAAHVVPFMLPSKNLQESEENVDKKNRIPNMGSKEQIKAQLTKEQSEKLFDKLDLSRIDGWSYEDQEELWKLIKGIQFLICVKWLGSGQNLHCKTYHETYRLHTFHGKVP